MDNDSSCEPPPGPEWERVRGGWRRPDGHWISDVFPYQAGQPGLDWSKMVGELDFEVSNNDLGGFVHIKLKKWPPRRSDQQGPGLNQGR